MWFFFGLVVGVALIAVPLFKARRNASTSEGMSQEATEDRQRVLEFMHAMAEALGEGVSREELNQRIVHTSILCSGALSGCLFEKTQAGTLRGVAVEGLFPPHRPIAEEVRDKLTTRARFIAEVLKSEEFPVGEGIVGRVAQSGRAELIAEAYLDPTIVKHDDPALLVRSVIAAPLIFREQFFGVLVVANPVENRPFSPTEFSLIQSLGEQAALALHNLEFLNLQIERKQLDMDLLLASGIQKMLLPEKAVECHGLAVDFRYAPAQKIGGDLYDLIRLSDTRLGIAVADVSGKGIPASLMMAICRTNLRQIAPRLESPSAVLAELNRALEADVRSGLYVTMLYCVVDTGRNEITYARAGHELPLFLRKEPVSGKLAAQYVPSEGMPLGMVSDAMFREVIVDRKEPFVPGDLLVLYTDGITEAPNDDGKEYSGARLLDTVRTVSAGSPREINDAILESVRRFSGERPQRDDLTLVTVRRL